MDSLRLQTVLIALGLLLGSSTSAWSDFQTEVLKDDPIGFWRMNETSGKTAVSVGTVTGFNGKYHGGEVGAAGAGGLPDGTPLRGMGVNNVAFSIAGENSFVGTDRTALNDLQEFTILGWVFPDERENPRIGLWGQNDVIEMGFIEPNRLQLYTAGGGTLDWAFDPSTQIIDREWSFLAATGDGERLTMYLNGEQVAEGGSAIGASYGNSAFPFNIGGGGVFDETGNQLRGSFDEVALFDKAVTPDRIEAYFRNAVADGPAGDFDFDGQFDIDDVNALNKAIVEQSEDTLFDLDGSGVLDEDDLYFWVKDIKITSFGDADLDGEFNSSDFVVVFTQGEYEDGIDFNSGWDEGDWNADLDFDSSDFVVAFQDGGYELPAATVIVPEPMGFAPIGFAIAVFLALFARRRQSAVVGERAHSDSR